MAVAHPVTVGNVKCGPGEPLLWIAGPCVIESLDMTLVHRRRAEAAGRAPRVAADVQGVLRQGQSHLRQIVSAAPVWRRGCGRSTPSSAAPACR